MSVRFFKIFAGVLMAHIILLSLIWVGFTVPLPRPPAEFTYEGTFSAQEATGVEDIWAKSKTSDQFILDHAQVSDDWTALREPIRP